MEGFGRGGCRDAVLSAGYVCRRTPHDDGETMNAQ